MIVVTGATGNVGRHVVDELLREGRPVRAISRNPEGAGLPAGVEVVQADLTRPDTLPAAVRGADAVFLFPLPGQLDGVLDAAREAGVGRVVLLSAASIYYQPDNALSQRHLACEQAVLGSGLPYTFLRPGAFMANDLGWAPGIKAAGVVRGPFGDAPAAAIDERDIAAVAARALLDAGHAGKTYSLTGGEALSAIERVRILGEALGRDLRFVEETREQARERMIAHVPAEIVDSVLSLLADITVAEISPAVREIVGRAPHTYADWAAFHADDFR
jgi:uncharacterized protein YbjT (DUF2867 family)